jgi:hypothetical protein
MIFVLRFGTSLLLPIAGDLEDQLSPHGLPRKSFGCFCWGSSEPAFTVEWCMGIIG